MLLKVLIVLSFSIFLSLPFYESITDLPVVEQKEEKISSKIEEVEDEEGIEQDTAIAFLDIPKINLFQKLYAKGDIHNRLEENIIFLASSSMPDEEGGNVILAGHSGYGKIAYFKNLYKLKRNDSIYLHYQGKDYEYSIIKIYEVPKTGEVEAIRDPHKKSITLITCYSKEKQLIVVGEQKNST